MLEMTIYGDAADGYIESLTANYPNAHDAIIGTNLYSSNTESQTGESKGNGGSRGDQRGDKRCVVQFFHFIKMGAVYPLHWLERLGVKD